MIAISLEIRVRNKTTVNPKNYAVIEKAKIEKESILTALLSISSVIYSAARIGTILHNVRLNDLASSVYSVSFDLVRSFA